MKRRKVKSRMTRVDLDAVLKLQRDYDYLQYETKRLLELSLALESGNTAAPFIVFDDYLSGVASIMYNMAQKIKKLEEKINSNEVSHDNK